MKDYSSVLKKYRGIIFHETESLGIENLERNQLRPFKIGITRNLTKFDPSTQKSPKFHFNGLLLSKADIV